MTEQITNECSPPLGEDFIMKIGSGADCDIQDPSLPELAVTLQRKDHRYFIRDEKQYNNDHNLTIKHDADAPEEDRIIPPKNQWVEVTRYDYIEVFYHGNTLNINEKMGQVDLKTSRLYWEIPKEGKKVCDGSFVQAKSGTLTAVMGPSGSGKTVLLNLLNGYLRPDKGQVFLKKKEKSFDLHRDFSAVRDLIAYVPQDEIMIPELTVEQSLHYRLRLRYPDMKKPVRERFIKQACKRLGFEGSRLDKFLATVIGSPEKGIRGLSGGEKRRANIAHEFVLNPELLILDEPTSGLSSADSDQVIQTLKNLAEQDGLTVIATLHQPSRESYALFDDLLLISVGGQLAYYGAAEKAVPYFETITESQCAQQNPPGYILSHFSPRDSKEQSSDVENRRRKIVEAFTQIVDDTSVAGHEYRQSYGIHTPSSGEMP